jgi:Fe-S-cluster containining protein
MHMRTPPFGDSTDPRWLELSKELKSEIENWILTGPRYQFMVKFDGHINPCIWLNLVTGECRHYNQRPDVCREFEVGNDSCRMLRKEVGLSVRGMPHPLE